MHGPLGEPSLLQIGTYEWELVKPFTYVTEDGVNIVVPQGFRTDGASSPFKTLIKPWGGHYPIAALIHDYLYDCLNRGRPHPAAPTRKAADRLFHKINKTSGVAPLVRIGMLAAVRIFGGFLKGLGVRSSGSK